MRMIYPILRYNKKVGNRLIANLHYVIIAISYQLHFKTPYRTYLAYDRHYEMFLRVDTSSDRRHLNETDLRPKFKLMSFLSIWMSDSEIVITVKIHPSHS